MIDTLSSFIDVNDPYIISRLFGCVYGAVLQSNKDYLSSENGLSLATFIYKKVFKRIDNYEDILLRDYALNTIKYLSFIGLALPFNINECEPPFKSKGFKDIDVATLKSEYGTDYNTGLSSIKFSMQPNLRIGDFGSGNYGDFGRYVAESALCNFAIPELDAAFKYMYDYIVTGLGYDNKLFTKFDHLAAQERLQGGPHERIGKKYEWIALYHVLAIATDNFKLKEGYVDTKYRDYLGS
jgi:hypothetical protein